RQGAGVDECVCETRLTSACEGGIEERHVEAQVVPDEHAAADELEQRREDLLDTRSRCDHRIGDPGEERDGRRDPAPWIDERVKGTEALTASQANGADLGDAA